MRHRQGVRFVGRNRWHGANESCEKREETRHKYLPDRYAIRPVKSSVVILEERCIEHDAPERSSQAIPVLLGTCSYRAASGTPPTASRRGKRDSVSWSRSTQSGCQHFPQHLGTLRGYRQQRTRSSRRLAAPLLPVLQRAHRYAEHGCKFLL